MSNQYRKKPVVIEAIQWTGDNMYDLFAFSEDDSFAFPECEKVVEIITVDGKMTAQVGDFIIKGVKGGFYPCKPDIFAATYEAVSYQHPLAAPTE